MARSTMEKYDQVMAALAKGQLAPVYCLYGPQRWFMGQVVSALRKVALQGKAAAFNHDRFLADEVEPARVADALMTVPMMGRLRLVEVGSVEKWKAEQLSALEPVLANFPDTACLLLKGENIDGRMKVVRQMASLGVVLKLDHPDRRQLGAFLRKQADAFGKKIDQAAVGALMELVGRDMGSLVSALEKATLFAGGRGTVRVSDVQAVVADTRQAIIFELTDAMGSRQVEKAISALRRLIADREPPQRILVMLARQVRLLMLTRQAVDQGVPPSQLGSHLDLHSFVAQKLAAQVGAYTGRGLRAAHRAVAMADRSLKRSRLDAQLVLEELLLKIMGPYTGARRAGSVR